MENNNKKRRTMTGIVVKLPIDKTISIRAEIKFRHPKYGKTVKEHKKYQVHFESKDEVQIGEEVIIAETRPISKRKNWEYIGKVEKK